MKKNLSIWLIVIISVLGFSFAALLLVEPLGVVARSDEESYAKIIASTVYDSINIELSKEYAVGQTMANDTFLIELLKENAKNPNPQIGEILQEYMADITEGLEYNTAFIVIDSSKEYYTQKGFNKIVDTVNDAHDIWYSDFLGTGKDCEFNVDEDETHGKGWTVFINCRIEDEEGNLLGVCGVGVVMTHLQEELELLQTQYGIQIYLVNKDGLIQVSVDSDTIEKQQKTDIEFPKEEGYVYTLKDSGYVVTRYMDDLEFYLVVEKAELVRQNQYRAMIQNTVLVIFVIIVIVIAVIGLVIVFANSKSIKMGRAKGLSELSAIYHSMHLINLKKGVAYSVKTNGDIERFRKKGITIEEQMYHTISDLAELEYREEMLEFTDLASISERLKGMRTLSREFVGRTAGWCRARFIVVGDDLENIEEVLFAVEVIEKEKQREVQAIRESMIDELTHCFNRKAYEKDVEPFKATFAQINLVYVSIDVNGLKAVNDDLGHAAGDELIQGAAKCMQCCLASYGRVYRTGGDEFIAVLFADMDVLENIKKDLQETVANWSGVLVKELSISCGYAPKQEFPDCTLAELATIADKRMYEAKEKHYQRKGIDRRGQQEAYQAICSSYTKLLKVNLTTDMFYILQMNLSEQTEAMGYNDSISQWLRDFAMSGLVHEDDREKYLKYTAIEYLRNYFKDGYLDFDLHYRRKIGDTYHRVKMEIIPAKEYTPENQVVFLYVKNIE